MDKFEIYKNNYFGDYLFVPQGIGSMVHVNASRFAQSKWTQAYRRPHWKRDLSDM